MRVEHKRGFICKQNLSSANNLERVTAVTLKTTEDSVSFSGKKVKMAKGFKKNAQLFMSALLLSVANHSPAQVKAHVPEIVKVVAQDTSKWWNKFNPDERKLVEELENVVAKRWVENGKKAYLKDTSSIYQELDVKGTKKDLVNNLLKEYEKADSSKIYFINLKHLSPRKQELKRRALTEAINYTFDTGKVLRYSDENIQILAEKIGAEKKELPFVKLFLKPHLDLGKGQPKYRFFQTELLGDFAKTQ